MVRRRRQLSIRGTWAMTRRDQHRATLTIFHQPPGVLIERDLKRRRRVLTLGAQDAWRQACRVRLVAIDVGGASAEGALSERCDGPMRCDIVMMRR